MRHKWAKIVVEFWFLVASEVSFQSTFDVPAGKILQIYFLTTLNWPTFLASPNLFLINLAYIEIYRSVCTEQTSFWMGYQAICFQYRTRKENWSVQCSQSVSPCLPFCCVVPNIPTLCMYTSRIQMGMLEKSYDLMTLNRISIGKLALDFLHYFTFNTNLVFSPHIELLVSKQFFLVEYWIICQIPNNKLYWFQFQ